MGDIPTNYGETFAPAAAPNIDETPVKIGDDTASDSIVGSSVFNPDAAQTGPYNDTTPVKIEDDTESDVYVYMPEVDSENVFIPAPASGLGTPSPGPGQMKVKGSKKKSKTKKYIRTSWNKIPGSPRRSPRIKKSYGIHPMDLRRSNRLIELAKSKNNKQHQKNKKTAWYNKNNIFLFSFFFSYIYRHKEINIYVMVKHPAMIAIPWIENTTN